MRKILVILLGLLLVAMNTSAEEIKMDRKQVDSLSDSDRTQIESILKKNRLILPNQSIKSADEFKGFLGLPDIKIPDLKVEACKAACDVSMIAAISACSGLSSGTLTAACTAAAVVARDSCKNGC